MESAGIAIRAGENLPKLQDGERALCRRPRFEVAAEIRVSYLVLIRLVLIWLILVWLILRIQFHRIACINIFQRKDDQGR